MSNDFQTLQEIALAAHRGLSRYAWDFLCGGSESETTLKRNRQGFDRLALRPRVLRDVTDIDISSTFLGATQRIPVTLAPMGSLTLMHGEGTIAVAKAAEQFGITSYLSSVARPELEDVGTATSHHKVYQLYVRGDRDWVADYVSRAMDHGFGAFCFTVDTPIYSRRERDLMNRFTPTGRRRAGGYDFQAGLSWDLIKWFKDTFDMPLILKGIATAEDAALAVEHEVEAVYVSNHGGRQLDHGRGAIDVLPEIADAVAGRASVVIDGGVLRGTDVVKAIALGADSVGIGKLQGWGLAAAGEAGLIRVLELLEDEIIRAIGLLGVTRLSDLDPSYVCPADPVGPAHQTSQYPHIPDL